jgi:hypothetical protein
VRDRGEEYGCAYDGIHKCNSNHEEKEEVKAVDRERKGTKIPP